MIDERDPLASHPLARRLARLDIAAPPVPSFAVVAPRPQVRARRRLAVAALLASCTALALTITAAAYPGGLGSLTEQALRAAGLSSVAQVTPVTGSAELAGVKVE